MTFFKQPSSFLLSLLSGVLLAISWPANGFPFLLFISLIPLLYMEEQMSSDKSQKQGFKVFKYAFLTFFIWNALTTWWIWNSSPFGGVMASFLNALYMGIVFLLYYHTKKRTNTAMGYIGLVVYWVSFEYLHMQWDLTWSWMNLGNGFANYPWVVQWYEYTGALGGTVWIWVINLFIFHWLKRHIIQNSPLRVSYYAFFLAVLTLPIGYSVVQYITYNESSPSLSLIVVQPNLDPYNEKFETAYASEHVQEMLRLAETKITPHTQYIVFPETALTEHIWEGEYAYSMAIQQIQLFLRKYPHVTCISGAQTYRMYGKKETPTETARPFRDEDTWYDAYNTALAIDTGGVISLYHKSKLVPGVEKMPFPSLLKPLESFAINLGGTIGSLGVSPQANPLVVKTHRIAPVICYESVYGEYVGEFVNNGAEVLFIITNDGWWGDSPGYRQHLSYARLRAIETRRSIARSANTGISGFINQRGDVLVQSSWWTPAVLSQEIALNTETTFYVQFGDYIGRIALFVAGLFLVIAFVRKRK